MQDFINIHDGGNLLPTVIPFTWGSKTLWGWSVQSVECTDPECFYMWEIYPDVSLGFYYRVFRDNQKWHLYLCYYGTDGQIDKLSDCDYFHDASLIELLAAAVVFTKERSAPTYTFATNPSESLRMQKRWKLWTSQAPDWCKSLSSISPPS